MLRVVLSSLLTAIAVMAAPLPSFGEGSQPVVLDSRSAARALDAVPAVFAVAQILEDAEMDLSIEGLASGYSDLANRTAAQEQLTAALGVYGFETYEGWAATIKTVFSTDAYIQMKGATAPEVDSAAQRILKEPDIPQSQKDAIRAALKGIVASDPEMDVAMPLQENLEVVVGLLPQIEATVTMMQAMQ